MPKRRWRSHFNLAFQLVEESFGFLEIDGIKAFGEPRPARVAYRGCEQPGLGVMVGESCRFYAHCFNLNSNAMPLKAARKIAIRRAYSLLTS
jgi:hypothetical protein